MQNLFVFVLPLVFLYWMGLGLSHLCWPRRRLRRELRKQAARQAKQRAADEPAGSEQTPPPTLESLDEPTLRRRLRRIRNEGLIWLVLGTAAWLKLGCSWGVMPVAEAVSAEGPELDRLVRNAAQTFLRAENLIGLVVAAVSDGEEVLLGVGRQDLRRQAPPDGTTLYEIGSITKTFTGILLARQTEDEQITLLTPLQSLLPAEITLPEASRDAVNLGHLTTHTAGFPRMPFNAGGLQRTIRQQFGGDPYATYSATEFAEALRGLELQSEPGTVASYSNFGTATLGWALAHRAGVTYDALVREQITAPLEMRDTAVTLSEGQRTRLVQGYRGTLRWGPLVLGLASAPWELPNHWAGAGGLRSTADDMLKFLKANMSLSETPLGAAIGRSHLPLFKESETTSFCMNWIRSQPQAEAPAVTWHNGGTGGFRSFVGFTEDGRHGVVVLTNVARSVDPLGLRLLELLVDK